MSVNLDQENGISDPWAQVSDFLEVEIPEELTSKSCIVRDALNLNGIERIASTRRPFTCLIKAVKLIVDDKEISLTISHFSENDCEGHFPESLEIPLLLLCKTMALSGEFLINWLAGRRMISRACGAEGVKSLVKDLSLLRPPAYILTLTELVKKKMGISFTSSYCWINANPVAKMRLPYIVSELKNKPRIV